MYVFVVQFYYLKVLIINFLYILGKNNLYNEGFSDLDGNRDYVCFGLGLLGLLFCVFIFSFISFFYVFVGCMIFIKLKCKLVCVG